MRDVLPKGKMRVTPEVGMDPIGDETSAPGEVVPHPYREERLKSGIKDLSARFPNAKQRASDAILKLIDMLSDGEHKLDQRCAEGLKVKLVRALAVLEAVHNRPETVSKEELDSPKQAMLLLHDMELRQTQMQLAGKARMSKRLH